MLIIKRIKLITEHGNKILIYKVDIAKAGSKLTIILNKIRPIFSASISPPKLTGFNNSFVISPFLIFLYTIESSIAKAFEIAKLIIKLVATA